MRLTLLHGLLACALFACALTGSATAASTTTRQTVGQQREDVLFWSLAKRHRNFSRMYRIFPALRVPTGEHTQPLGFGKPLVPQWQDGTTLAEYMHRYHVTGVMVVENGQIRLQHYAFQFGPKQRWTSFSVAKSVTSVLLGIALKQGYVHSLDDPVTRYLPTLKGTAYDGVTVRDLLTMTSGVQWNEDYTDPDSDVARMYDGACVDHQSHVLTYLSKLPRKWPPGTHFHYNTAQIDLLGDLIQHATGRSLATYLSQTIWKPYGMVADAFWLKDACNDDNTGGSGLSARLIDYALFGQFMLDGGKIDGRRVIAKSWWHGARKHQEDVDNPERGYGYLWWTDRDGSYAAIGIFGQLVYVDPSRQLVIVQVATWPKPDSDAEVAARRAFVAAIKRAVDAESGNDHAD